MVCKPFSAETLPSSEPGAEFQSLPRSFLQWELNSPTLCGIASRRESRPEMETLSYESPIRLVQVTKATAPPHPTGGHMTCLRACLVYHQHGPPATSAPLAPQSLGSSRPCCPRDTMLTPTSGLLHMLFPSAYNSLSPSHLLV